jgi:hypothetical protein
MADGKGVQKIRAEGKIEEQFRDEDLRMECIKAVMRHGREQDQAFPWNHATKLFYWVKYQKPDMQVL